MKAVKYIASVLLIGFIAYNSVYFKKLDEVKASQSAKDFNAAQYAATFWNNKLVPNLEKAIDFNKLASLLITDTAKTFEVYSHALGIGNLRYFLIRGKGVVESVNENDVTVTLQTDSSKRAITLATEYIFGNAARDATGLININEFSNTMDFNNVSAEINKIIREKVLPPFKQAVKNGNVVEFTGAIELNKEHLDLAHLDVVPVQISMSNQ